MEAVYQYITPSKIGDLNKIIMDVKDRRDRKMNKRMKLKNIDKTSMKYLTSMLEQGRYIDDSGFVQNIIQDKTVQNIINGDMKYSELTPKEHEQLGTYDKTFNNRWDNDYVLLNTDKWKPAITHQTYRDRARNIATGQLCTVSPVLTSGYPVRLKEFDLARKVLPPDNINIDFINEKLKTGIP
jgi:hypothetical protein